MFKKSELNSITQPFTQKNTIKAENDLDKDETVQNASDTFHMWTPALNDDEVVIVTILMTKDIFSDGSYLSMYAANNFSLDNSKTTEISQCSSDIDETNLFGAHNNYSFFQPKSEKPEDVVAPALDKTAALSPIPNATHDLRPMMDYDDASLSCLQL